MAIQLEKSLGSYDTEDSRTKENHSCFEICALCLSSPWSLLDCTCGKIRWGLEDGARSRVEGDYEGVHKCGIDI